MEAPHLCPSLHRKEGTAMCSQPESLVQGSSFGWLQDNRDSDLRRGHCQVIMFKGVSGLKGCRVFVSEKWIGWKLTRSYLLSDRRQEREAETKMFAVFTVLKEFLFLNELLVKSIRLFRRERSLAHITWQSFAAKIKNLKGRKVLFFWNDESQKSRW